MAEMEHADIFVAGGGIAGLTAALAFAQAGWRVVCADPKPISDSAEDPEADLRTTAFLQPSQALFDRIGLWPRLAAHATPLQVMKIVNLGATYRSRAFDAADIGDLPFGWNIPNWLMRREVHAALQEEPLAFYRAGISASSVLSRTDHALVTLSDGSGVRAKLVLAADGRASGLRDAAGIGTRVLRYGQKALAFAVTHKAPHDNVSTEIHRAGGPCTFVPLPDHGGRPASAVVWMDRATESVRRHALGNAAFEVELLERSGGLYGPVKLASRRSIWPISSQLAKRFYHGRMALIAEAAHAIPPIGAQGLNMSLADIACLLDLAEAGPDRLGDQDMLARYDRRRRPEVTARVLGVDALNRASMVGAAPLQALRAQATGLLHDIKPLRQGLMLLGMAHGGRRSTAVPATPPEAPKP
ncbi:MAG: FAD-dependent monooxygenase [Pseudomonadota bacterium]